MDRRTLAHDYANTSPHRFTAFPGDLNRGRETVVQTNLSNMTEEEIRKKKAFVWGWGKNKNGELSIGVTKNSLWPHTIKFDSQSSTSQVPNESKKLFSKLLLFYFNSCKIVYLWFDKISFNSFLIRLTK